MSESGKIPENNESKSGINPDAPGQVGSQMDLLDNFLKQISGAVSLQSKAGINVFEDIQSVQLSEYCVFRRLIRNVSSLK